MFRDLLIGQYVPGESPVHRLDPRTKLVAATLYVLALFFLQRWAGYAVASLLVLAAWALSGLPLRLLARSLRPVAWIAALTVVLHALFTAPEGQALVHWGPVRVTAAGLDSGLRFGLRLVLLMVASSLLTLTTSPIQLADGIERLARPLQRFGFPAHELAMMMTIALRFIPTLMEEAERIIKAQTARGADFGRGSVLQRIRSLVPVLVPLFVGAFRRADDLALAMESRCYRGAEGRTRMRVLRMGARDAMALAATAVSLAVVVGLGRAG